MPEIEDLNCRQARSSSFLEQLPNETIDLVFSLVAPIDYMSAKSTCKSLQRSLTQGACLKAHCSQLLPGIKIPQELEACTKLVQKQYTIRRNIDKGKCNLVSYQQHKTRVTKVVFAGQPTADDVYTLVTAGMDQIHVTRIDPSRPYLKTTIQYNLEDYTLSDLAVTPDGRYMAVAVCEIGVLIFPTGDSETPKELFANEDENVDATLISFSSMGTHIVTWGECERPLLVWDVTNLHEPAWELSTGNSGDAPNYAGIQCSPQGQSLVAWTHEDDSSNRVHFWSNWKDRPYHFTVVQAPAHAQTAQSPHRSYVTNVCFSSDAKSIVTASKNDIVNIYNIDDQDNCVFVKEISTMRGPLEPGYYENYPQQRTAKFTSDKHFLLTMSPNKGEEDKSTVQFWNPKEVVPKPRAQEAIDLLKRLDCTHIDLSTDNRLLALGGSNGRVTIIAYD